MPLFKDRPVLYKSFFLYPEESLLSEAKECLYLLSCFQTSYSFSYFRNDNHTCLVAERGRLSLNFQSAMMRGIVIGNTEAILDEAYRSVLGEEETLPSTTAVYTELEREERSFIDHFVMA